MEEVETALRWKRYLRHRTYVEGLLTRCLGDVLNKCILVAHFHLPLDSTSAIGHLNVTWFLFYNVYISTVTDLIPCFKSRVKKYILQDKKKRYCFKEENKINLGTIWGYIWNQIIKDYFLYI